MDLNTLAEEGNVATDGEPGNVDPADDDAANSVLESLGLSPDTQEEEGEEEGEGESKGEGEGEEKGGDSDEDDPLGFFKEPPAPEEDDKPEESDDPVKPEDMSADDQELLKNAAITKEGREYLTQARESGKVVDPQFLIEWLARDGSFEKLSQGKIYSYADLMNSFKNFSERDDADRDLVPMANDIEGWEAHDEKYRNVPREADGYPDEIFDGIKLAETEEDREAYRQGWKSKGLSIDQARAILKEEDDSWYHLVEKEKEAYDLYKREQQDLLKEAFGEDHDYWIRTVLENLRKIPSSAAFLNEFRNTKTLHSASLITMLKDYTELNSVLPPKEQMVGRLSMYSKEKLEAAKESVEKSPEYTETYRTGTPDQRAKFAKANAALDAIMNELSRRY